jgi:hypothetical protein
MLYISNSDHSIYSPPDLTTGSFYNFHESACKGSPQRSFSKVKKGHPTCKRLELATHGNLTFRAQEFTGNLKILRAQQGSQLS